jgi:hypothetical protein
MIAIISLNEMSPRCRPQQHCRGKRHGKYTHNVMHDPSHRRYLQHQRQLRLSLLQLLWIRAPPPAAVDPLNSLLRRFLLLPNNLSLGHTLY